MEMLCWLACASGRWAKLEAGDTGRWQQREGSWSLSPSATNTSRLCLPHLVPSKKKRVEESVFQRYHGTGESLWVTCDPGLEEDQDQQMQRKRTEEQPDRARRPGLQSMEGPACSPVWRGP